MDSLFLRLNFQINMVTPSEILQIAISPYNPPFTVASEVRNVWRKKREHFLDPGLRTLFY